MPTFDPMKNFAVSTVATAPSPATTGTSLTVASGQGALFPSVPFNCVVCPSNTAPTASNAEIIRVTAQSTDTFTILRAQEGTTAQSIGVGWQIWETATNKVYTDIENTILNGLVPDNNTATYVSATSFTLPYNATSIYTAGRQLLVNGSSVYYVSSSSYSSPNTTVNVTWNASGGSLPTTITSLSYQIAPLGSTQIEGQYQIQNSTITGSQIVSNPTFQGTASDSRNILIAALGSYGGIQQNNLGTGSVVEADNGTTGYYNIPEGNVFAIGVSGDANVYTGVVIGPPGGVFTNSTFYLPSQTGTVRITYIYMT